MLPAIIPFSFACVSALEPLPEGTRQVSAPAVYQLWWTLTEGCSGRTGAMSSIEWFVVPGVAQFEHKGAMVSGLWSRSRNRIVLAERAVMDGGLVRHEILHALLGHAGHPREAFLERCGGLVVCLTSCLRDAGPPPMAGPSVARVPASEMQVDVAVNPVQPGRGINDGHFRLVVTVTNARSDSVVVLLPSSGDAPPRSFSFLVSSGKTGLWFTEHAWDSGVTVFGPGATRQQTFDFRLADTFDGVRALPEGTYLVKGGFGPASSASKSFVFGQQP